MALFLPLISVSLTHTHRVQAFDSFRLCLPPSHTHLCTQTQSAAPTDKQAKSEEKKYLGTAEDQHLSAALFLSRSYQS